MHSIYWVITRNCNQRCPHCYNDSEPGAPGLSLDDASRCIDGFPDPARVPVEHLMLSGGEVLVDQPLLFHVLGRARAHFGPRTELMLQTNGDLLDEQTLDHLLHAGVTRISVASMDKYHKPATVRRADTLRAMFERHGLRQSDWPEVRPLDQRTPLYNIWGAAEESWIGKLWPRGRARHLGLSRADHTTDFCGNWSGAKGFLDYHTLDCQVSLQLSDVYPCCPMTCRPIGDARLEPVLDMLDRLAASPVFQALNRGQPEAMGESLGIPESHGRQRSIELGNHCLWCDEFFTRHAPHLLHQTHTVTTRDTIDLTVQGKRYRGVHPASGEWRVKSGEQHASTS